MVGVREHVLKSRMFGRLCVGLRHFRRVSSNRKAAYLRFFVRRYSKLREVLDLVRIVRSVDEVEGILRRYGPALVIIDDKLSRHVSYEPRVLESAPKPKYMNNLITIADNLANHFRILLKEKPRKFGDELRSFEK